MLSTKIHIYGSRLFLSIKFQDVTVAFDSQIVLQWLLTVFAITKSVFTSNHIKEISVFLKNLVGNYGISVNFKYVENYGISVNFKYV